MRIIKIGRYFTTISYKWLDNEKEFYDVAVFALYHRNIVCTKHRAK